MDCSSCPLVEEDYYLVCLKPMLDSPLIAALRSVLASPAWAEALQAWPGLRDLSGRGRCCR